jgi:predicted ArsR family transcriptional regulator
MGPADAPTPDAAAGTGRAVLPEPTPTTPATAERSTRDRIARLIMENGPVTAAALSARLGLTPAAVRRHLDNLLADGLIEPRSARPHDSQGRGRGRPARLFAITDAGRCAFEHAYDDLASSALQFIAELAGPQGVTQFARRQVADLERKYRPVVAAAPPDERVRALAQALSADGYAAGAGFLPAAGGGEQLCQHHCPVAHVAELYPELCEAETEAFGRLLGTPVQRLATIAHGDGICTTHVTAPALARHRPAEPHPPGQHQPGQHQPGQHQPGQHEPRQSQPDQLQPVPRHQQEAQHQPDRREQDPQHRHIDTKSGGISA